MQSESKVLDDELYLYAKISYLGRADFANITQDGRCLFLLECYSVVHRDYCAYHRVISTLDKGIAIRYRNIDSTPAAVFAMLYSQYQLLW